MAPETPQEQAYFKFREKESESMRDLRHKAFEHVELVALSLDEVQDRKMEARADDHDIQHLAFLFGEFEPRCYLFVVFECLRRLALTGLLIFVYNGSATQVVVGLFIAVISKHIMMHFNPYIEDSDDWLANQGQLQIVLLFLASLVLFVKTMPEQEGAPGNLFRGPLFAAVMVATCANQTPPRHCLASMA